MIYIYNHKNRTIRREGSENVDLTYIECRFIEVLANEVINTTGDILNYMYEGYCTLYNRQYLSTIQCRVIKKTKLNIGSFPKVRIHIKR